MKQFLLFHIGSGRYAVKLQRVRSIHGAESVSWAPLSHQDSQALQIHIDGKAMPLYDLLPRPGRETRAAASAEGAQIMVLKAGDRMLALQVDRIEGVAEAGADQVVAMPPAFGRAATFFPTVYQHPDRPIPVLDPDGVPAMTGQTGSDTGLFKSDNGLFKAEPKTAETGALINSPHAPDSRDLSDSSDLRDLSDTSDAADTARTADALKTPDIPEDAGESDPLESTLARMMIQPPAREKLDSLFQSLSDRMVAEALGRVRQRMRASKNVLESKGTHSS